MISEVLYVAKSSSGSVMRELKESRLTKAGQGLHTTSDMTKAAPGRESGAGETGGPTSRANQEIGYPCRSTKPERSADLCGKRYQLPPKQRDRHDCSSSSWIAHSSPAPGTCRSSSYSCSGYPSTDATLS
eukprot:GHVU01142849.1.p2 GENE.GHVU01142849.1~~GHVU01142849.1.p2  ORF type:complete len:130 (+),score=8.34 GHVU01142849.1:1128-1517(+)